MNNQKSKLLTIKKLFSSATIAVVGTLVYSATTYAGAPTAADSILSGADKTGQKGGTTLDGGIEIVTNVLLFLIGVVSVIMIILGGIRYTTSNGDASQAKAAKDTILYAVVGLIIAIMAYAIVQWVVSVFM